MAGKRRSPTGKTGTVTKDPGMVARLFAEWIYTLAVLAGGVMVLSALAIYSKITMEKEVPPPLIAYLAAGVLFAAAVAAVRFLSPDVAFALRRNRILRDSRLLLREVARSLKAHGPSLREEQREELEAATAELEAARDAADWDRAGTALLTLDRKLDEHFATVRKSTVREYAEAIGTAFLIALVLRAFVVEAFKIPSGSMIPTLQVGDHIFVNKFIYGIRIPWTNIKLGMDIRKPRRGEVAVFKFPKNPEQDFIKRIVAIEGDTVEIKDNVVYVNNVATPHVPLEAVPCEYEDFDERESRWEHRRCDAYQETLDGHSYTTIFDRGSIPRSWPAVTVGPGQVFVMGDNRDNSHDSRYWGTVPFDLLKGKAMIIWWSSGEPEGIRVKRMGKLIE